MIKKKKKKIGSVVLNLEKNEWDFCVYLDS